MKFCTLYTTKKKFWKDYFVIHSVKCLFEINEDCEINFPITPIGMKRPKARYAIDAHVRKD